MDIYSFMNSKDIAEHLKAMDYQFTAYEMAYLVYQSKRATLEQKLTAYQDILSETPDCEPSYRLLDRTLDSTHELLTKYIDLTNRRLDSFPKGDGYWYSIERSFYGFDSSDYADLVFASYVDCIEYLREEISEESEQAKELDSERIQAPFLNPVCKIAKRKIGEEDKICEIELSDKLEPLDVVDYQWIDDPDDVEEMLANGCIQVPVPFKAGDIVKDCTLREPSPFVFTYLQFWDSNTLEKHGVSINGINKERIDKRVARNNERHCWDDSHMVAMGVEIRDVDYFGKSTKGHMLPLLWADEFGAADNYLDLDYDRRSLVGASRILKIASLYEKGELGPGSIETIVNLTDYLAIDSIAKKLRAFIEEDYYSETIRALIADEVLP